MKNLRYVPRFRQSLRFRLVGLVLITTVVAIIAAWILSNNLVKSFYILDARSNLTTTYESCNRLFMDASGLPRPFVIAAEELYANVENPSNATIFIVDYKNNELYSTVVVSEKTTRSLQQLIDSVDFDTLLNAEKKYKFQYHGSSYDLIGILDNGNIIILERPMEQLNSSILFSTRLFLIIAVVILSFEASIVLVISGTLTRPIIRMSHAAKRMSKLNFEVKAPEDRSDEIGELGHSMNEMAQQLEKAISELKSANASLSQDIEEKERLEEMRSEFLSHVSHELKTPLALIQGYSEGLKDTVNDDPESREFYCDVIMDEAAKMNQLIMQLLNLNEMEFGNTPLNIVRFDVVQQIHGILQANRIMLEQKNVQLQSPDETPVYVWADAFKMSEVFTNYLSNAIHYVKEGGVIRVTVEERTKMPEVVREGTGTLPEGTEEGQFVPETVSPAAARTEPAEEKRVIRVSVYNQGPVLSEEALEKVFVKFYKEDAARTRSYGGSGIGLSIVEAIQKSHHQDYGVYNAEDGVVFYYELDSGETKTNAM